MECIYSIGIFGKSFFWFSDPARLVFQYILCIRSWECIDTGNWYSQSNHNRVLKSNWGWQSCLVEVPTIGSRDSPGTIKAMGGKRGWRKRSLSGRIPLLRRMEQEQQRGGLHLLGSRSHTNFYAEWMQIMLSLPQELLVLGQRSVFQDTLPRKGMGPNHDDVR